MPKRACWFKASQDAKLLGLRRSPSVTALKSSLASPQAKAARKYMEFRFLTASPLPCALDAAPPVSSLFLLLPSGMLTQAGIGQSTCVSIGGDPIVGSTFLDLLPLYEKDPETKALVLFCEPGGSMEEQLAAHLSAQGSRLRLFAFVAGRFTDRNQGV